MPRGDKPTTVALALKDGWVYEDALPEMTQEQYDCWFKESLVLDGIRMGPPLIGTDSNPDESLVCANCNGAILHCGDKVPEHGPHWYHVATGNVRCPIRFAEPSCVTTPPNESLTIPDRVVDAGARKLTNLYGEIAARCFIHAHVDGEAQYAVMMHDVDEAFKTISAAASSPLPAEPAQPQPVGNVLNMVWAENAGVSVWIYKGRRDDWRVVEIRKGEQILATATIANHNRDDLAESISTGGLRYSPDEVAKLVRAPAPARPEGEQDV